MKKIIMLVILILFTCMITTANNSYNLYIENELSKQSDFYEEYNLEDLEFDKDFTTIISDGSLSRFDYQKLILMSQTDSLVGLNEVIEKSNQYKIDPDSFALAINSLENEIIEIKNQINTIIATDNSYIDQKYTIDFVNISDSKKELERKLDKCKKCYEMKDTFQWLEVDYDNLNEIYIDRYLDRLEDFETALKNEIDCSEEKSNCELEDLSAEFIVNTKKKLAETIEYESTDNPEIKEKEKLIIKIQETIKELQQNKNTVNQIIKQINNRQKIDQDLLVKLNSLKEKDFSNPELEKIRTIATELIYLLEQPVATSVDKTGSITREFESVIGNIIEQVERNNEFRTEQIALLNIILNSYHFKESNDELEKIYFELTNQVLLEYTKEEENKILAKQNILSDLKILKYNYQKLKAALNNDKVPEYKSESKKLMKNYNILLKEILNKLNDDRIYDLKTYDAEVKTKEFTMSSELVERLRNDLSTNLVKLKTEQNKLLENTDDFSILKVKNQFLKDILLWLEIYIPRNSIQNLKLKNENYLLLHSDQKSFSRNDLFNLNESEVIEISQSVLDLISSIQYEVNRFEIKNEYNQEEIQNLLNLMDYYFFANYLVNEDTNSFWVKISMDSAFNEYINNIIYNKLITFESKNQQNFAKNIYNKFLSNRLNPNKYFIRLTELENSLLIRNEFVNETDMINLNSFEQRRFEVIPTGISTHIVDKELSKQDFEIIKYAITSLNAEYQNTKVKKTRELPVGYEILNLDAGNKLDQKLTYQNNLDYHSRLDEETNGISYADITIMLKDRVNIGLINGILNEKEYSNQTSEYKDAVDQIINLKYTELQNLIESQFDRYSNDPFNEKYLDLTKRNQVDPLINFLNSLIQKETFYKQSRLNGAIPLNQKIKINKQNIELLNSFYSNRVDGYIISQNKELLILKKALNQTIDNIQTANVFSSYSDYEATYSTRRNEFLDLLDEHLKLKLILEAIKFYELEKKTIYDSIYQDNEKIIQEFLSKDDYTIGVEYNVLKSNIQLNYNLIQAETSLDKEQLYLEFDQTTDELIRVLDSDIALTAELIIPILEKAEGKILSMREDPELNESKDYREQLLIKIQNEIRKTISNIIRKQVVDEEIKAELISITTFSNLIEREIFSKTAYQIIFADQTLANSKQKLKTLITDKRFNTYETKRLSKKIKLLQLNGTNKEECLNSIKSLTSTKVNTESINQINNYITNCEIYLKSIGLKEMSKNELKDHFYLINEISTNYYLYLGENRQMSDYIDLLNINRELLASIKANFETHKFQNKTIGTELSEWLGANSEKINQFNTEAYVVDELLDKLNIIQNQIILNSYFNGNTSETEFESAVFALLEKQTIMLNTVTEIKLNEFQSGKNMFYYEADLYETNQIDEIVAINNYRIDYFDKVENKWLTHLPNNKLMSDFDQFVDGGYYIITVE